MRFKWTILIKLINPICINAEVLPPLKQQFKQSNLFDIVAVMKEKTYNLAYFIFLHHIYM